MKTLLSNILSFITFTVFAGHTIIPEPVFYQEGNEILEIKTFRIIIDDQIPNASIAISLFEEYALKIGLKSSNDGVKIKLVYDRSIQQKEGYKLAVYSDGVKISAKSYSGLFYGFQTLKQLLPPTANEKTSIQYCEISDYPRFEWRGLMMDVSRHFFTVEEVKQYIEKMSEFKFNTFHWHLTDDEGWRVEIKSLPKLTEVGAWRGERKGRFGDNRSAPTNEEPKAYGGYYTQEQIKDVVEFAQKRNVTIVPEIDVPGHSMALLAAYPELSTKKEKIEVSVGHKFAEWFEDGSFKMYTENMLDPTNNAVYKTLDLIYGEVATLFPGEYIHMGGDECYKGYWEESQHVQDFMKKKKMKDMHDLQAYFIDNVQKIIRSKGKKMIGWDEITEGHLNKDAAVMSWQGMKGGIKAAKLGHKVVMSPTTFAYLDYIQGDVSVENSIYASLSLEKSYSFEPAPDSIDERYVMGGQGNLWTEVIPNLHFAYYMTYPRGLSIAETLWSPKEKKDWNNFVSKTIGQFERFEAQNTNICEAVLDPIVKVYKEGDKILCKLTNNVPGTKIFYSIDNTYPVKFGLEYEKPFELPSGDWSLRTQTFLSGKGIGRSLQIHREDLMKRL